jgi:hypothetical protein
MLRKESETRKGILLEVERAVTSCSAFLRIPLRPLPILVCCGVLVLASGSLSAAGEYQQARDGKTMVWNATPKSGDTASWSGGRDEDNYATGFGHLAWYDASGKEQGVFYGNMVRGKFEGAVNMHSNGRTMHAYYANGGRVTAWARGRAPANMRVPEGAVAERRKSEEEAAKEELAKATEPEPTPVTNKAKPVTEPIAKTEPSPQPLSERPPRGPGSYHKETAEKPAIVAAKKTESLRVEPPVLHEQISETRDQKSEVSATSSSTPPAKETQADLSVNALAGPLSSLRTGAIPESSPENQAPSPTPKREGPLTEPDVISLVDTEARANGAPIDQYDAPKVDHSAVKGKWTLFYARKADASVNLPKAFTATVEDKTHQVKVEIHR